MHASTCFKFVTQLIELTVMLVPFRIAYSGRHELEEALSGLGFAVHYNVAKMMAVSPSS